jgi:peptidoglycan/LPS O-acetylase OafA/YrhL
VDFSEVAGNSTPLVKIVYLVTGFSHYAVMIFFVLSGFLVGGTVLRGWIDGKWSWSLYAANRMTRLWIVLIPALILGAIWDRLGISIFGTSGIYGGLAHNDIVTSSVLPRLSGSVMLGNALFLQDIRIATFGTNHPLWSLSFEFWYYVLFPLMVMGIPAKKAGWSAILYAIGAITVAYFIGRWVCLYFLIWLLGAAINFAPEPSGRRVKLWIVAATIALLSVLAVLRFNPTIAEFPHNFAVGTASAALILALLRSRARSALGLYSRTVRRLAGFSYTLYVVHVPALAFISARIAPRRWQPDAAHLAAGAALALCTLAYAFAIAQFTEDRTGAIRSRLTAALGLRG